MTDQPKQLADCINARFDEMEARIRRIRCSLASTPSHVARAILAKFDEAVLRVEGGNAQFQAERAVVYSEIRRELVQARGQIHQLRIDRDATKLAQHADKAEQNALGAFLDATDAIDRAEVAALEALVARSFADEIASAQKD